MKAIVISFSCLHTHTFPNSNGSTKVNLSALVLRESLRRMWDGNEMNAWDHIALTCSVKCQSFTNKCFSLNAKREKISTLLLIRTTIYYYCEWMLCYKSPSSSMFVCFTHSTQSVAHSYFITQWIHCYLCASVTPFLIPTAITFTCSSHWNKPFMGIQKDGKKHTSIRFKPTISYILSLSVTN